MITQFSSDVILNLVDNKLTLRSVGVYTEKFQWWEHIWASGDMNVESPLLDGGRGKR